MTPDNPATPPSIGELFSRITGRLTSLLHSEIDLVKAQLKEKVSLFATAIALFAVAGVLALYGLGWLFFAAYAGLAVAFVPWLAALILGVAILVVVAVLALVGKAQITKAKQRGIAAGENIKLDVAAVKEGARR